MSYISDIVKLVKGGKESFVKKMKLYFYIAIGISIYVIVFGLILLITHGIIMFTKNVPVIYSCPYNYSSYGLNAETSFPIIGTVVDTVVGVIYSNKRDPETCQKTCEKRCLNSEDSNCLEKCKYDCRYNGVKGGVLNGYRDSILNNLNFQIVRTIVVVFVISILGVTFLFGFTPMRASELLKKLAILGLFLFATDSRSYVLYDQFLEPLVLEGSKQLSGMINGILLASMDSPELIAFSNAHPNNEFIVLDASIAIFFSQAIFDKMGALTFTDMGFMFMAPIFYLIATWIAINYFFFSVIVVFYRVVIVVGLSLFPMFVLFTAMAITSKSLDKTTKYFTNYIQEVLIKPTIAIFFLTYVMSFFAMLILELVLGVFSFQVCVKRVFTPPFGLDFVLPTFDYYEAVRPFAKRDVAGTILAFDTARLDLPYINPQTNQVDPNSLEKNSNTDILFSMMILNFILLSLYGILFRKIFGVVIQTAEKLNAAFGGSGLGEGGGGFKDIMDKASEYGGKAADLASQKIESAGDSVMSQMGEASKKGIAKDMENMGRIAGNLKEGVSDLGNAAKENFTKAMESLRNNSSAEGGGVDQNTSEGGETGANANQDTATENSGGAAESGSVEGESSSKQEGESAAGGSSYEGATSESSGVRSAGDITGEAGKAIPESGSKGGAKGTDSIAFKPEGEPGAEGENPTIESETVGRTGAAEPEKEIQKEKDIIKKTIRHKQNIETEEMEGEQMPSEEGSANNASNAGVGGAAAAGSKSQAPNLARPNVESEGGVIESEESGSKIIEETPIQLSEDAITHSAEGEIVIEPSTPVGYNQDTTIEEGGITSSLEGSQNTHKLEDSTSGIPPENTYEAGISSKDEDFKSEREMETKQSNETLEGITKTSQEAKSLPTAKADQDGVSNIHKTNTNAKIAENIIDSPLGHQGNTALGHEGEKIFEHGANNPVKDEINTPFNLQSSTPKEGESTSFETKIKEVEAIAEGVEKNTELMQKVQAAKEKKDFLDQNVKAVSKKEDIAKFRKKSTFLNNQNKDKK